MKIGDLVRLHYEDGHFGVIVRKYSQADYEGGARPPVPGCYVYWFDFKRAEPVLERSLMKLEANNADIPA